MMLALFLIAVQYTNVGSARIFLCNANKALNVKLMIRRVYHLFMFSNHDLLFQEQVIRECSWAHRNITEPESKPLRLFGEQSITIKRSTSFMCAL